MRTFDAKKLGVASEVHQRRAFFFGGFPRFIHSFIIIVFGRCAVYRARAQSPLIGCLQPQGGRLKLFSPTSTEGAQEELAVARRELRNAKLQTRPNGRMPGQDPDDDRAVHRRTMTGNGATGNGAISRADGSAVVGQWSPPTTRKAERLRWCAALSSHRRPTPQRRRSIVRRRASL